MSVQARFLFFLFSLLLQSAWAQLSFDEIPADLQMFPRDKYSIGHFTVSGSSSNPAVKSVRMIVRQRNTSSVLYNKLQVLPKNGSFSFTVGIAAQLADYDLEMYSINQDGFEQLEKQVTQLVAGDFFIVSGQSNATGAFNSDSIGYQHDLLFGNPYCRTIGTIFQRAIGTDPATGFPLLTVEEDCKFRIASSLYYASGGMGCIGTWPMRILNRIVKEVGVPVCIINGAIGSSNIDYHLASQTPSDPANLRLNADPVSGQDPSTYDRLFRKLFVNNALGGVKGIFWYQGESDAVIDRETAETYNKRFAQLRQSWHLDYPNLEKIFVFQINTGCGGPYQGVIREQQRRMPGEFNDVIVLPTVGSGNEHRLNDGCHYSEKGYAKLGENMAPVVLKYLYHLNLDDKNILGPDIRRIYYSKSDQLCLTFNNEICIQQFKNDTLGTIWLKDYFYNGAGKKISVTAISSASNNVYLQLEDSLEDIQRLTYLPGAFSDLTGLYTGPWILNKNNPELGALSFFEFPVEQFPTRSGAAQPDELVTYPNPAKDFLALRTQENNEITRFFLYDALGNTVFEYEGPGKTGLLIDLRAYQSGLYFLSCKSKSNNWLKKIVVRKEN